MVYQMRHTHLRVLHLFEFLELLFIITRQCKLMQYAPMKLLVFPILSIFLGSFFSLLHHNYVILIQVPSSLNSTECFLLQSGSTIFTWHGNQSSFEQQQLAAKVAEFLRVRSTNLVLWTFCSIFQVLI